MISTPSPWQFRVLLCWSADNQMTETPVSHLLDREKAELPVPLNINSQQSNPQSVLKASSNWSLVKQKLLKGKTPDNMQPFPSPQPHSKLAKTTLKTLAPSSTYS